MLEECDPVGVALIRRMRARGAPGPMIARNSPTVPAPAARMRIGGLFLRARLFLWSPHQQPTHPGIDTRETTRKTLLYEGGPPGAARRSGPAARVTAPTGKADAAQRSSAQGQQKSPINRTAKT